MPSILDIRKLSTINQSHLENVPLQVAKLNKSISLWMLTGDGSMMLVDTRTATMAIHGISNTVQMTRHALRNVPLTEFLKETGKTLMESKLEEMTFHLASLLTTEMV